MFWWSGRIGVERRASLESQAFVVLSFVILIFQRQFIVKRQRFRLLFFWSVYLLPVNVHAKMICRHLSDNGVRETFGFSQVNHCNVSCSHGGVRRHMFSLAPRQKQKCLCSAQLCSADELRIEGFRLPGGCRWHRRWQLPVNLLPQKHRRLPKANPAYAQQMVERLASISVVCSRLD